MKLFTKALTLTAAVATLLAGAPGVEAGQLADTWRAQQSADQSSISSEKALCARRLNEASYREQNPADYYEVVTVESNGDVIGVAPISGAHGRSTGRCSYNYLGNVNYVTDVYDRFQRINHQVEVDYEDGNLVRYRSHSDGRPTRRVYYRF